MVSEAVITESVVTTTVERPPYVRVSDKFRNGIKQTAFHEEIGRHGRLLKVHNTYLKPYYIDDPIAEYWTLRRHAALFDVTGEQVIEISGPGAFGLINDLVPRDLARLPDGHGLYAIMCYDFGGIVEDAVLIRFSAERFWWVGGLGYAEQWLWGNARGRDVDVTSRLDDIHIASLQGPKSRDILAAVCGADITGLVFYGMVETTIAGRPCVITRTGYTMELGFEVYVAVADGAAVFAAVKAECLRQGGCLAGSRTMGIRRIEAGLIDFGADFDWHHTPYEVGLQWMLNTRKPRWRGRDALIGTALATPTRRLVGVLLADATVAEAGDRIRAGGRDVGEVRSATFSPSLDRSIAIALLAVEAADHGTALEVDRGNDPVAATVTAMPFLDPERRLARG